MGNEAAKLPMRLEMHTGAIRQIEDICDKRLATAGA